MRMAFEQLCIPVWNNLLVVVVVVVMWLLFFPLISLKKSINYIVMFSLNLFPFGNTVMGSISIDWDINRMAIKCSNPICFLSHEWLLRILMGSIWWKWKENIMVLLKLFSLATYSISIILFIPVFQLSCDMFFSLACKMRRAHSALYSSIIMKYFTSFIFSCILCFSSCFFYAKCR